jgi:hypothetical protein
VGVALATVAVLAALGGSAAYTYATASQPHAGPIPSSGPAGAGGFGSGLRGLGNGGPGAQMPGLGGTMPQPPSGQNGGVPQMGTPPSGVPGAGRDGTGTQGGFAGPGQGGLGQVGGQGGIDGGSSVDTALIDLLKQSGTSYRWPAAMSSASNAAPIQLASGAPILAIGGFNGSDQSLTLAQFQKLVTDKQIHYYIAGGGFANSPNSGVAGQIESWVQQNFTAATVGSATVYDLTAPASTSSN